MTWRKRIKYQPAPDRNLRRVRAQYEAIAEHAHDLCLRPKLDETILARFDLAAFRQHEHARQHFRGAEVNAHTLSRAQRARRTLKQINEDIDRQCGPQTAGGRQDHATLNGGGFDSTEVDGRPLAG